MNAEPFDYDISAQADLARLRDIFTRSGHGHYASLVSAAMAGGVAVIFSPRGAAVPMGRLKRVDRPALVLVGDDDHASTGPDCFPSAKALARWCNSAVIHGAGADAWQYAEFARQALRVRRLLLVETASAQVDAWRFVVRNKPALIVVPSTGAHPIAETVH